MSKGKKAFPTMPFQVCGKPWVAYFASTRYMNKKYGKSTLAVTECDDKEVFMRTKALSYETAVHELFHCFIWESGARSMDLSADQMEELCAEMFSKHAKMILTTGEMLVAYNEGLKK